MSTLPISPPPFVPPGATFPPDLYTELVAALFQPGMRMLATDIASQRYGWPVNFREMKKEKIDNRVSIARLAQTCKTLNTAVKTRLKLYAQRALSFHMQNTIWAAHRFARKPYTDRAEMHRLWWPERWPYESNADMDRAVERYTAPQARLLKLFVVWMHRRHDQLAVQVGIHEHEGPLCVFKITDQDPDEDASDTASDGDSIMMTDSEDEALANAEENEAEVEDGEDPIQTELGAFIQAPPDVENNQSEASQHSEASESEEADEMEVQMITAIDDVDTVENDPNIHDAELDNGDGDDQNPQEIDLHYSATRPRWIDRERGREDVTAAELSARVEAWIRLQYHNFFPLINEPN